MGGQRERIVNEPAKIAIPRGVPGPIKGPP
jgi:hypothetical protein